jgi:hypothetical protein
LNPEPLTLDAHSPGAPVPWINPDVRSLERAVFYAVAYADIYRYPLTLDEVTRYLVGVEASKDEVRPALDALTRNGGPLLRQRAYVMLRGAEGLVALRRRRAEIARHMWPQALSYGRAIARLPFVRMVAVTGALTMGNVESGDDIDYFIVTEPARVWLARFFIVQRVVKPAARQGVEVCPNYLISSETLTLEDRDLFHAHELVQMVPLYGLSTYRALRAANPWALRFLPNAGDPPRIDHAPAQPPLSPSGRGLSEALLRTPPGTWFDRREMVRMQAKLTRENGGSEVKVTPDRCKGHIGSHGHRAFEAFAARIGRWRAMDG